MENRYVNRGIKRMFWTINLYLSFDNRHGFMSLNFNFVELV